MGNDKENKPLLQEFLDKFELIPLELSSALLQVTTDEDEKKIINALGPILVNQFKELSIYISESSAKSTLQHRQETEMFLKISSGVIAVDNIKLALPSIGSAVGKLGIVEIIHMIKKIIDKLIKNKPGWLVALLDIIDEIINTLFAGSSMKIKNMLSTAEQNFLKEIRLVALLEKVRENDNASEEDDE